MKATLSVLAMLVAMSQAKAQNIQYDEATNTVVETKAASAPGPVAQAPVTVVQSAPIAQAAPIVQQAPAPAPTQSSQSTAITVVTPATVVQAAPTAQSLGIQQQVVEQPTTVIEDQPVKDSRQELLKKARGKMEDHTERSVEEKIEEARIRDEKKRADRLNNAIDQSENQAPAALIAPVAPIAVAPLYAPVQETVAPVAPVVIAPNAQAVVIPEGKKEEVKVEKKEVEEIKVESDDSVRPVVREELRSDMNRRDERKEEQGQGYIGALGGVADYPSANNIKANGSAGVQVGYITKNRIVIEGSFAYSAFDINQPDNVYSGYQSVLPYKNLSQYNMMLGLKYQILPGTFRPFVGVLGGYTKRNYTDATGQYAYGYGGGSNSDASSDAIDLGFNVGIDFAVSSNILIGLDFRYLTNLSNHVDNGYQNARSYVSQFGTPTTPVEELDYYSAGVTAKFLF